MQKERLMVLNPMPRCNAIKNRGRSASIRDTLITALLGLGSKWARANLIKSQAHGEIYD
jgi:hypothetical protein